MKEVTAELRRRLEAEENERRAANQQNQLRLVKYEPFVFTTSQLILIIILNCLHLTTDH